MMFVFVGVRAYKVAHINEEDLPSAGLEIREGLVGVRASVGHATRLRLPSRDAIDANIEFVRGALARVGLPQSDPKAYVIGGE
jgi:hypothetical protein